MKRIISATFSFIWLSTISIAGAFLLLWLSPYIFVSSWWKVAILLVFGTWFLEKLWNLVVPILATAPVVFAATKCNAERYSWIASSIPPVLIGIWCIYKFWTIYSGIPFDAKDWVMSIVWNYISASCFYHLFSSFALNIGSSSDTELC